MNESSELCAGQGDAPPARIWSFSMDGYVPPLEQSGEDMPPTAADLAADRLIARLAGLRLRLTPRWLISAHWDQHDTHATH